MTIDNQGQSTHTVRVINNWYRVALIGLGVVALTLRVVGAGWSLPYVDHPDEPAIVGVLLRMLKGDLNPKHFFYPTLIMYLQAVVFQLHIWWGTLVGTYSKTFTLPNSSYFYTTIPGAFIWSRVCTALFGTTTVLTMATWGARVVGKREAFLAATLLAFSGWAIIHDHYITVDGPSATTGFLALLTAIAVLHYGNWRSYLLAGVCIGIAAGTKYQNVLVAASVALAHVLHWRTPTAILRAGGQLGAAALVSALVFLATTPYIVLAPADFWHDIHTLLTSYNDPALAHGDVTGQFPLGSYLSFYWHESLEPVPSILALIGIGVLFRRRPAVAAVLLLFPLLMVAYLLHPYTHFYRNLLPTMPPLLLFAGVGGIALLEWLIHAVERVRPSAGYWHYATWFIIVGCGVLVFPTAVGGVHATARLAQPDSRVVAQHYIHDTWHGVRVASELSHPLQWNGITQSEYVHYLPLHSPEWYREQGYGILLANDGRRKKEAWTADYAPFLEKDALVATFGGSKSNMLGPRIDVLDSGLTPESAPALTPHARIGALHLNGVMIGFIKKQGSQLQRIASTEIARGRIMALTVFWHVVERVPQDDYMLFVHLRDAEGRTLVQRDTPPWQNLFPPHTWQPDTMVVETLDMWLPYEVPPGTYTLFMGMYTPKTMARFPAFDEQDMNQNSNTNNTENARFPHDEVPIGTITIVD